MVLSGVLYVRVHFHGIELLDTLLCYRRMGTYGMA